MHRSSPDLTARVERVLRERLLPAVHGLRAPVEVSAAHLPGKPEPFAAAVRRPFAPFAVGDAWGRAWSTTWFRLVGPVPESMRGRRVELLVDLGFDGGATGFCAEGLAYRADGTCLKGLAPRSAYLPVARPGELVPSVDVYVEAAANPRFTGEISLLGDPATAPDTPLYRLARAELGVLEEEVHALVTDVRVVHGLALVLPEADPRRHHLRRALEEMLDELDPGDVAGTATAARSRLAPVLASTAAASAHRVSAVGHAHIDSAWLWPVRETVRKCSRTFANVTALAEDYPELVFACSSAQQYAWVQQHHPLVWERVRQAVATGQFVPVGGMWVESDTNLPGGESLVRQFLHGKRFFAEELGVEPREVWLPDSFGYTAALPQIARLAGCRWFLSQKMSWNTTNPFPHHTFWWEGIDGTRIFTHFPPADTYSAEMTAAELAYGVANFAEHGGATRSLLPFGHGDGGGGPTREMLEAARRLADLEGAARVRIEPPSEFFAAAQEEYPEAPVWSGEMYLEMHRGTLTSQAAMKRGNRRTEHLLREAELWAATAACRAGTRSPYAYPYEELEELWREALLLQFHDILPGSSIAWVHQQAREAYGRLAQRLETLVDAAQAALAGDGQVPLVFNAAPHERSGVPPMGAAPAALVPDGGVTVDSDADGVTLDNGLLRLTVGADGTVTRLRDLVAGREVLPPGARANVLQLHRDLPSRFDAWDVDASYRRHHRDLTAVSDLVVIDEGDRASVRVVRHDRSSRYEQTVGLAAGARAVDFETVVDWHEQEHLLKVALPVDVHAERFASETQFGHLHRATHTNTSWDAARFETCAHRWVHVGEPGYGVAVVNDSTYGHDVTRPGPGDARGAGPTTVRLSLLRGPRYPDPRTDQGEHRFGYALVCGAAIRDAVREGYRTNLPERRRPGVGPVEPLVRVDPPGAVVEALKLAEDRSGDVVVRLYESSGGRVQARLRPSFPVAQVHVVDLLERSDDEVAALAPLVSEEGPAGIEEVRVPLRPFQVVTLRLVPRS